MASVLPIAASSIVFVVVVVTATVVLVLVISPVLLLRVCGTIAEIKSSNCLFGARLCLVLSGSIESSLGVSQ